MKSRVVVALGVSVGLPLLLWIAACGLLWFRQDSLLFPATSLPRDAVLATGDGISERRVVVSGASLSVLELRLPDPDGVVFFLHGNGGNLQEWFVNADFYRQLNYDLVMMDYRGYGKSTGHISSEAQLHADVSAVWQSVAQRYVGRKTVIYGRSLGTALAARLASHLQPDLTVLVSPYVSIKALAREKFPWAPAFILRYPLRTDLDLLSLRTPVMLLHGEKDELIPLAHSQKLHELAMQSQLVVVSGAGHNDVHGYQEYRQAFSAALLRMRRK